MEKIKELSVRVALAYYYFVTTSFDLWMSKGVYDIFAFVINLFGIDW
jgi:hypothetical protein